MIHISRRAALGLAALPVAAYLLVVAGPAAAASCNNLTTTVTGTAGDDLLYGTDGNDVIAAGAGIDIVFSYGGNDTICGEDGDDQIHAGTGDDWVDAGFGADVVKGEDGTDTLAGAAGNDGINGGFGNDTINGGPNADFLVGHSGADVITGGSGNDALYGGYDNDTLYGYVSGSPDSTEPDYLAGGPGTNTLVGASPDDLHPDTAGFTDCPPAPFHAVGTYNPSRLAPQDTTCVTITGKPMFVGTGMHQDGDYTFDIAAAEDGKVYHVEFMARDKYRFPVLSPNTTVQITGMKARDTAPDHGNKLEVHPVFKVVVGSSTYFSGPQHAGSPEEIRPSRDASRIGSLRYCWSELGSPCQAWDTATGAFN